MKLDYVLTETDSEIVFAVISNIYTTDSESKQILIDKVALAVKDEYTYENIIYIEESMKEGNNDVITLSFTCFDDGEEEDIREVELNVTAIY